MTKPLTPEEKQRRKQARKEREERQDQEFQEALRKAQAAVDELLAEDPPQP